MHRGRLLYVIAAWGGRAWKVGVGPGGDRTVAPLPPPHTFIVVVVCLFWFFFFTLAALNKEAFFTTCFWCSLPPVAHK